MAISGWHLPLHPGFGIPGLRAKMLSLMLFLALMPSLLQRMLIHAQLPGP